VKKRKLISQRHPLLYFLAVWVRRTQRKAIWLLDNKKYTKTKSTTATVPHQKTPVCFIKEVGRKQYAAADQ